MGTVALPPFPAFLRKRSKESRLHSSHDSANGSQSDSDSDSGSAVNAKTLRINSPRQLDKTLVELFAYAVIWWAALAVSSLTFGSVSRVMVRDRFQPLQYLTLKFFQANMSYIFWVAAYNTSFLTGYILLDFWLFPSISAKTKFKSHLAAHAKEVRLFMPVAGNQSVLLAAINRNGILLFLLVRNTNSLFLARLICLAGKCGDWTDQSIYADDVCAKLSSDGHTCWIYSHHLLGCMATSSQEL